MISRTYDVSADGKRFLMVKQPARGGRSWWSEVEKSYGVESSREGWYKEENGERSGVVGKG